MNQIEPVEGIPHDSIRAENALVKINGVRHYLWRAVDHDGEVLEAVVTKRRDRKTALKFLKKLMKRRTPPVRTVVRFGPL